ncbi:MAG: metallophosphoesterase [Solobacterium sp.]|nr:metallophosphoesterase [Solobacterium sp.]
MTKQMLEWLIPLGAAGAVVAAGLPYHTDITTYTMHSSKISHPVRIALLADFHNDRSDKGIKKLTDQILAQKPDLILMPGDMAEEHNHQERTFQFLKQLEGIPMYYSTGNHEEFRWDLTPLKQRFREHGVVVLDEKSEVIRIHETELEIAGISCRMEMSDFTTEEVNALFHTDHYRILLSHKPNWVELYRTIDCDLTVCGHAHGGQWHIPFLGTPVAAPSQGFFPKYTQGIHDLGRGNMLISRGLVRHYHGIPRLYNNPEIVILDLVPQD